VTLKLIAVAALVLTLPLSAQQPVADRLRGAAPEVVQAVETALAQATERGLPGEPLVQKAIEGTAKSAPPERIVAAINALLERLGVASRALRESGVESPDGASVEAGAFALSAGLGEGDVVSLARAGARSHAVEVTLRVAGTLAAIGVPAAQVLQLVNQALEEGPASGRLAALPGQVQAAVARGAPPAAAAQGLARAAENRANRPDPPRRPPRPEHPTHP